VNHELTEKIKHVLGQQCSSRALDNEEDFKIVIEAIATVIDRWIETRCPGCK